MSQNDFSAEWTSMVHNALSSTVPRKRKKRATRPFNYSSHTMHMLNKLETLERKQHKLNSIFNEEFLHATRNNFLESAELDKVVLLKDICWMSTSEAFKFLKRFSGKAPCHLNSPRKLNSQQMTGTKPIFSMDFSLPCLIQLQQIILNHLVTNNPEYF